jgi:hypothetical protein
VQAWRPEQAGDDPQRPRAPFPMTVDRRAGAHPFLQFAEGV